MADFPKTVHIVEEGPREGFQFEPRVIPTARKIELTLALAETGLDTDPGGLVRRSQAGARMGRCGCRGGGATFAP